MRWLSICLVALALATAAGPAAARPPNRPAPAAEPTTENEKVDAAIKAWSSGDWTRVRTLLEPLVQGDRNLAEASSNEAALRYLADATLQDEATLDAPIRTELATGYIERLLASSPDWRPPDIHSRQFYALYNTLREKRDRAESQNCISERAECQADKDETTARLTKLQNDFAVLQKAFGEQEVEVREKVARNRAVALIPFGVGHFYNGRKKLGAVFLASEIVFGGVALGLFIERTLNCTRTNGFRPSSLQCKGTGTGQPVVDRRNAEQTMALFFVGTMALDILLAQVTFRPFLTVKSTRMRRQDLEKEPDPNAPGAAGGDPRAPRTPRMGKQSRQPNQPRPSSRTRTHDILRAKPAPVYIPGGGGLGFSLEF